MFKGISDTYKKTGFLHHAYLVDEALAGDLLSFIENDLLVTLKGNPDFLHISTETFGITEGRRLKDMSSRKAIGERQITVIAFNTMTLEAQNALLKLFEEPTPNTHFFLVTRTPERILPTLLSRLFVIRDYKEKEINDSAKKFLKMKALKRISYLQPIIEEKDKEKALSFLIEIELLLRKELLQNPSIEKTRSLKELGACRGYLFDRGSSVKMILEHIALTV